VWLTLDWGKHRSTDLLSTQVSASFHTNMDQLLNFSGERRFTEWISWTYKSENTEMGHMMWTFLQRSPL
jgi:hypothetical protein